ncbi:phasin family protein [Hymenobacter chitinivorans]|uniref:Polyhydroxyalkanoate synthesis regulator phasin n=1 Tax=Hymenobacter chitinivorans DSM 11115 TaxID=1121954 RepID=A0A2M9BT38_9BACT|nr:hypothetical protein [Hymenobacter chitinivorans]PJJ61115.1 polyhydroxyalkanoate synthesis regulator phasin [Hymenobacter chitinivorans DSM 11115]
MEDLFKKFINAGVGFVSLTSDRVQTTIDALVKESKLSEQEGKKIMDDLRKNSETKRKELEQQFSSIASKLMKSVGVASNSDVEELKRSVKGGSKSSAASSSSAAGSKSGAKTAAKPAASTTAKAAGATKQAAAKVSSAAGTAQKSSAAKAGAAKSSGGSKSAGAKKETPAAPAGGTDAAGA